MDIAIKKYIYRVYTLIFICAVLSATGLITTVNAQVLSEIRTSNHSAASVTITWVTDVDATGQVRYRPAGTSDAFVTIQESRGRNRLHMVRPVGLSADTGYEFEVQSGGAISSVSVFHTTTADTPTPQGVVIADIFHVGGVLRVNTEDALLMVTLRRFDDGRRSFPLSTFSDAQGTALITLNLYDESDGTLLPAPRIGDSLSVEVLAGKFGAQAFTTTITTDPSDPIDLDAVVLEPVVLIIPADTSTVVFETADSTRSEVTFTSGDVEGFTITFESFGPDPPVVPSPPPFTTPVLYVDFSTTISDTVAFQAEVTLTYTDSQLLAAGITDESTLVVAWFDEDTGVWNIVPTIIDTMANTATFTTDHFSVWGLGVEAPTDIEDEGEFQVTPQAYTMRQNTPNPFNPATAIVYETPQQAHITLTVYNLLGQEVIRLVDRVQAPGRYRIVWHGRNARGQSVASGVYMYRLASSTGYSETKRMTLIR